MAERVWAAVAVPRCVRSPQPVSQCAALLPPPPTLQHGVTPYRYRAEGESAWVRCERTRRGADSLRGTPLRPATPDPCGAPPAPLHPPTHRGAGGLRALRGTDTAPCNASTRRGSAGRGRGAGAPHPPTHRAPAPLPAPHSPRRPRARAGSAGYARLGAGRFNALRATAGSLRGGAWSGMALRGYAAVFVRPPALRRQPRHPPQADHPAPPAPRPSRFRLPAHIYALGGRATLRPRPAFPRRPA